MEESMYSRLKRTEGLSNKDKIIYYGTKFSGADFVRLSERVGGFLSANGIKEGDVVGVALPNIPESLISIYGINAVGAIANLIHPRIGIQAMEKLLASTKTKILFVYDKLYRAIAPVTQKLGILTVACSASFYLNGVRKFICKLTEPKQNVLYFSDIIKNDNEFIPVNPCSYRAAVYIHSGGTAGEAKTVVHDNASFNALADAVLRTVYKDLPMYDEHNSMLMMLPVFHSFGLGIAVHTIVSAKNVKIILLPRFREKEAVNLIKKYRITHLAGVPSMYRRILERKNFRGKKIGCLEHLFCGGDVLSDKLKSEFDERLRKSGSVAELTEGYGLTETASVFSLSLNGKKISGSQGKPLIGNEIIIADDKGKPLPVGEIGELYLKSVSLMRGYLNDDEGTAKAIVIIDGERYLKSGDLGRVDENGYIYFSEREKRSVKISAVNVFPSEVEKVLSTFKEIDDCCVIRTKCKGKPATKAYIVMANGYKFDPRFINAVEKRIKEAISRYAVPRVFEEIKAIPKTPLGKSDYVSLEKSDSSYRAN